MSLTEQFIAVPSRFWPTAPSKKPEESREPRGSRSWSERTKGSGLLVLISPASSLMTGNLAAQKSLS
eukprot:2981950-Alexandrium_andersonii.AAC.1